MPNLGASAFDGLLPALGNKRSGLTLMHRMGELPAGGCCDMAKREWHQIGRKHMAMLMKKMPIEAL